MAVVKRAVAHAQERVRSGGAVPGRGRRGNAVRGPRFAQQHPTGDQCDRGRAAHLGRAGLSSAAVDALLGAAGYTDVELTPATGRRARRGRGTLAALAAAAPAAESVLVVNNGAAALVLATTALAAGREVVVSRGEMVEIGDGFRLLDLIASTAPGCGRSRPPTRRLADYAAAVGA